mmetsp:Transcript_4558/g.6924  ORF Transcript_4558/g.6924 Transcript_4558/m.6924 type:complete len:305 (+) Transcript_4558:162-1076(+)
MKFSLCSLMLLLASSSAFVVAPSGISKAIASSTSNKSTMLFSEESPSNEGKSDLSKVMESGSHEELMYALGVNLARQLGDVRPLVENGDELACVAKGLLDAVVGRLEEDGQKALLATRGKELNKLITDRANNIRQKLETAGRQMLEEMSKTEGTVTLDSGVVIDLLEAGPEGPGAGVRPTQSSTVKVHYHGTLPDGTVFDSTLGDDEPVKFPLAGVIKGWSQGLLKMHEGETAMLGIPPELAYGDEGTPDGRIPGGSTLFFKVQLVEVMTAGIGGSPQLLGADGQKLKKGEQTSGLLGADGKPL